MPTNDSRGFETKPSSWFLLIHKPAARSEIKLKKTLKVKQRETVVGLSVLYFTFISECATGFIRDARLPFDVEIASFSILTNDNIGQSIPQDTRVRPHPLLLALPFPCYCVKCVWNFLLSLFFCISKDSAATRLRCGGSRTSDKSFRCKCLFLSLAVK